MTISEMHSMFRTLGQQKGMQHVRGILPEEIDDYLNSSIANEQMLAKFIKDTLDDPDGAEGLIFNRWIADMKWLGIPIPWDEFI